MVRLNIKKLSDEAIIPKYATKGDAGMDLFSMSEHVLKTGERCLVSTGLSFEIPEGYEVQVRPRRGLALKKGISLVNSPGTVDSGYRGEIGIIVINHGEEDFEIKKGDKIAQAVINKFEIGEIEEVNDLSGSERGEGGFGSTGL